MKKRYLYSSIVSSVFFVVLVLVLDFNIIISILLSLVCYLGGIFLFKEKDVRKYDANIIMHYCYLISKIDNYTNLVKNKKLCKEIKDISTKAERIIVMLEQKPDKVTQIYDGFDYFLPFTIRILDHYVNLEKVENKNKEEIKFINDINETLDYLEKEIDKMLENMNYTKMLDINASIEVFRKHSDKLEHRIENREGSEKDA